MVGCIGSATEASKNAAKLVVEKNLGHNYVTMSRI